MNSREAEENGESRNRRRRENKSSRDDGGERVSGSQKSAFADFVSERAGRIGRDSVNEVVKRVERDCDSSGAHSAVAGREDLRRAKNEQCRREIADTVREHTRERRPF